MAAVSGQGTALPVPLVDLCAEPQQAAAALRDACTQSGFAVLSGHGVPQGVMDGLWDASRRFFALPPRRKAAPALLATQHPHNRGYSPPNEQKLDASAAKPDTKEGYYVGRELPADEANPLQGPNNWPPEDWVPGFRSAMMAYHAALVALSDRVLSLLALALDLPADWFKSSFDKSVATLRPLHYSAQDAVGDIGAGAHTDFGCITLLLTDQHSGLQLFLGGQWVDVPPRPDCFVMNIGDMLERWTNGLFKSTLHRVVNTGVDRYSTAFFVDANFDAVVECLPTCCGPANPAKYLPVLAGQHLMAQLKSTHTEHALDSAASA